MNIFFKNENNRSIVKFPYSKDVFLLKCINVTFSSVDDAEFAMSTLKNEFEFSYSLINDIENEVDTGHDTGTFIFPTFYNASNLISPYTSIPGFIQYPMVDSIDTHTSMHSSYVRVRIKCKNIFSNEMKNRLINLNGRHIKII
jgi:hypothetical protein